VPGGLKSGLAQAAMRTPAPVSLDIGPDPAWLGVQVLVLGLAVSVTASWVAAQSDPGLFGSFAAAASGLLPAGLAVLWSRSRARRLGPLRLVFDGQVWTCAFPGPRPARERCAPVVALDLGGWMLLRIDPASGYDAPASAGPVEWAGRRMRLRWVALSRRSAAAHWHALRVALYSFDTALNGRPSKGRPEG
jgi:hypothetical protein